MATLLHEAEGRCSDDRGYRPFSSRRILGAKTCLPHLPQRPLEDAGDVVDLLGVGGEVVVERDGDARASCELGNGEVPLLEPELGAVERLRVDGARILAAPPCVLSPTPRPITGKLGLRLLWTRKRLITLPRTADWRSETGQSAPTRTT